MHARDASRVTVSSVQAPALWHLDLSDNLIKDGGAKELAARLASAPHATLSLRRNQVTAATAAMIASKAPKAAILDVSGAALSRSSALTGADHGDAVPPDYNTDEPSGLLPPVCPLCRAPFPAAVTSAPADGCTTHAW